jgi:NAD(P)-dependent dehydrogenase (short-subunit alcohol dehydrogenase family)
MERIAVVTGAASGIGAATLRHLQGRGVRVIGSDLHDADVIADLATADGRAALVEGVVRLSGGRVDAVIANAGGGPPETSVQLNFFGAVATLEGLRPLLAKSAAPRAVAVSSIASLRPPRGAIVEACLKGDERAAIAAARAAMGEGGANSANPLPADVQPPLDLYGSSKHALQRWCRTVAPKLEWAGAGIALNVTALGFYDTPAAAYVLSNSESRGAMERMVPLRGAFPGRAAEAAALLGWLVSAENSQMTGQILFADAGFECRALAAHEARTS